MEFKHIYQARKHYPITSGILQRVFKYFYKFLLLFLTFELVTVVANRVQQKEIMKAYHEGIGVSQQSKVLSSHFGRDKMEAIVVAT